MKPKLLICWRYFPEYRKEIMQKLSNYFDLSYMYGNSQKNDAVIQIEKLEGVNLIRHAVYEIFNGFFYFDLAFYKEVKINKPDYIVIQPTPRDLTIFFKLIWCKLTNTKVIGWGMGKMPGRNNMVQKLHDIFVFLVIIQLDKMICYSSTASSYYKSISSSLVCDVLVNTKVITDDSEGFKKKKSIVRPKSQINIVFLGRLIASKQVVVLLEACSKVLIKYQLNVCLNIIGTGPEETNLKESAKALDVTTVFHGFKRDAELYEILRQMDIFVLPSLGGLAIIDALYSSLPIISGPADGTENDLVIDGYNGYVLAGVTIDLIADVVYKIHSEDLYGFGYNSKTLYEENHHIDKFVSNFANAVEN